jgi:hypothetical protein
MERKKNILDKIGTLIPGYEGYANREVKRNSDKVLRDFISYAITDIEASVIIHQNHLIKTNELQICKEWDIVRKSLNTLASKIKYTPYGESSFFSENQIKDEELDAINKMDLEISDKVDLMKKLISNHIADSLIPIAINNQIREIEELINDRTQFIRKFK